MYTGRCFVDDGEGMIGMQAPRRHRQRVFEGGSNVHSNRTRRYDEKFSRHRRPITELHASNMDGTYYAQGIVSDTGSSQ